MNIEEKKEEYIENLNELHKDALKLIANIKKAEKEVMDVKTQDDMKKFDDENNLENGLKHIVIF